LRERVDRGVFGNPIVTAAVRREVVAWAESKYRWLIDPQWIVRLPALMPGIHFARVGTSAGLSLWTSETPAKWTAPQTFGARADDDGDDNVRTSFTFSEVCSPTNPIRPSLPRPEVAKPKRSRTTTLLGSVN
jgi:hypothetical protein